MRAARSPFIVALLAVALAGCSSASTATGTSAPVSAAPTPSAEASPVTGITAGPRSSALQVQALDLRLVRVGTDELALQFEFANNTDRPISPDTLGIDQIERIMVLVDLPRGTTYEMLTAQGLDGRLSENNGDDVPPGGAATVTAVFPAPPEETTELAVLIDGMLPAQVPVQPAGSPTLVDDPVLQASSEGEPRVGTVLCSAVGPADAGGTKKTVIRLPADVLFAFGSAELTPAAKQAIAAVDDEIGSGGTGTVTIEGHTDAIGSDADNQALSERRAAAVRTALEAELGSGYQYRRSASGRPAGGAQHQAGRQRRPGRARAEPAGGDPHRLGRAGPPPTLEPLPVTRDLADAGLRAEVAGLERHVGYLLARLTVTNPTGQAIELGAGQRPHPEPGRPDRADPGRPHRPAPPGAVRDVGRAERAGLRLPGQPEHRVRAGRIQLRSRRAPP